MVIHFANGQYSHLPQRADSSLDWPNKRPAPQLTACMEEIRAVNELRNKLWRYPTDAELALLDCAKEGSCSD